ncbi:6511_t:CDS:2, partial [Ambispora gerdemannii]
RSFSLTASRYNEVEVFVDGKPVRIEQGSAVIQACELAGVAIPRFCYHERLSIAGNCRMCLVELERSPKPVASCSMPIMPGMKIMTDTPVVKKAREGVMEFLLANHPLDCPICDQGGECDLQDQSVRYGSDRGRFHEIVGKRAVEDKDFGPLVKTTMTRCIHCTRCVRFATEVAGAPELGSSGRGNDMQISMYIERTLDSEMSANIIDLCPVGALTAKPYAFSYRPWELKRTESIDVLDAIGSNIRVDSRGIEVMRILPRINDDINEEWISDKTRFAFDGLKRQRLTIPLIRQGNKFSPANWEQALTKVAQELRNIENGSKAKAIAGQLADVESLVALKDLFNRLGSDNLTIDTPNGSKIPAHGVDFRSNYLLNSTIARVEEADVLLLVGTNPRHEGPILNTRIRKSYLHNGLDIGLIGYPADTTYEYEHIGKNSIAIERLLEEKHPFTQRLAKAKRPLIIVGSGVTESPDAEFVFSAVAKLTNKYVDKFFQDDWQGYGVLQRGASHAAIYDIGFIPSKHSASTTPSFIYLLNADEVSPQDIPNDAFVVYQGHHGDTGANYADVILPGAAYTEKNATYVNTEGRPQTTRAAVPPPGAAREDWKVTLSEVADMTLPYDDIHTLRERIDDIAPHLTRYDILERITNPTLGLSYLSSREVRAPSGSILRPVIQDFYMTDSISRASQTMAKCSAAFTNKQNIYINTTTSTSSSSPVYA